MERQARKNPKTIVTIPDDLVKEEILPRLPVKSLLRFKSVSKQWRSLIRSSYFVGKHLVSPLQRVSNPTLLVLGEHKSGSPTFTIQTFSRDDQSQKPTKIGCFTWFDLVSKEIKEDIACIEVVGSCDGLVMVCIEELFSEITRVYIINPATRKQRELHQPQSEGSLPILCDHAGFGKDIVTGTYKLIYFHLPGNNNVLLTSVSTLDKGCKQRNIGVFPIQIHKLSIRQASVYANGSVFWLTRPSFRSSSKIPIRIVALDLYTEKFRRVSWPSWYVEHSHDMRLWSLKDGLCLSGARVQDPHVDVWSLKMEDLREKWNKIFSINVSSISQLDTKFWMLGLAAAYLRSNKEVNDEDRVLLARHRNTLYTETLLSPYIF